MNLKSLVIVLLRLMALGLLLQVVVEAMPQMILWAEVIAKVQKTVVDLPYPWASIPTPWTALASLAACAVCLWLAAPAVAHWVTRAPVQDFTMPAALTLTLADCYSVVFLGLGLWYATSRLPSVINWAHYLLTRPAVPSGMVDLNGPLFLEAPDESGLGSWYDGAHAGASFLLGVLLVLFGRRWALSLARRQTAREARGTVVDARPPAGV